MGAPALVLVYHQVVDAGPAGADLAVHPERFAAQLDVLGSRAAVVPLARIRDRARGRARVAITFDDGYLDNLETATPMLTDRGLPATCFVTGWSLAGEREFWWDELDHLLGPAAPDRSAPPFETVLAGRRLRVELAGAEARRRAAVAIAVRCYGATPDDIRASIDALAAHLDVGLTMCDQHRHLGEAGVRRLADLPGITIGAHTMRHAALTALEPATRDAEIRDSKRRLEALVGRPVTEFAFPFGHEGSFDDDCERAVAAAGFELACRNVRGRVTPRTDPFRIPRLAVGDWSADEFAARLDRWIGGRVR
ncbi:MAG: polysaccharide deacetylase family protein [Actinomycetes bacterium]